MQSEIKKKTIIQNCCSIETMWWSWFLNVILKKNEKHLGIRRIYKKKRKHQRCTNVDNMVIIYIWIYIIKVVKVLNNYPLNKIHVETITKTSHHKTKLPYE